MNPSYRMNDTMQTRHTRQTISTIGLLVAAIGLLLWMISSTPTPAQATEPTEPRDVQGSGADLTVEVSIEPAIPAPNQQVTINALVKNIGTLDVAANFRVYLYVDPADRPPNTTTTETNSVGYPSLRAGRDTLYSRTHTFTTTGCDHIVYIWVDRDNAISESNETNNLIALPVCVGVTCAADSYESDNLCTDARWLAEGPSQARSLCHPDMPTQADTDWIKFTAFSGITYTLQSENRGIHAQGQFALYDACGGTELVAPTETFNWQAPADGVYYASFMQDDGAIGPLSAYSLTLASDSGLTDLYEPDNRCADARTIATDGARQSHLFQAPNDEDWIKFAINAGDSFIAIADNTGSGVNPIVTLFDSCAQVPANNSLAFGTQQVSTAATTDRTYYARITNQNGARFGTDAGYDIRVVASTCLPDSNEEDDTADQAQTGSVGGTASSHNFCPASDEDWVQFSAEAGKTYVLRTTNLAFAADTVIQLYDSNKTTVIAENDDYNYVSASRVVWTANRTDTYYVRIYHINPVANGPNTSYDFLIQESVCTPDPQDGAGGDNGPGDATLAATSGLSQTHNFCADPLSLSVGDQDWLAINTVAGGNYQVVATGLGSNSDPVLELYGSDGRTHLLSNDDVGTDRSAQLQFTPTAPGAYYVRVRQYNPNIIGDETNYSVQVFATEPPTPTPTPSPTPTPTPSPTPSPTPPPPTQDTLILVNRARIAALYGDSDANALMDKLFELAEDPLVDGLVMQVESDPNIAAAYASWTANATSLADNDKANAVTEAIRNRAMAFLNNASEAKYVLIIGGDEVIPFHRVLDQVKPSPGASTSGGTVEEDYEGDVTAGTTTQAALAANMILTDDYLVDKEPDEWEDKQHNVYPLYLPDYATGRLVETPTEMIAFIDNFLGDPNVADDGDRLLQTNKVLVTGYDFVRDSANLMRTLFTNDTLDTDGQLISPSWTGSALRTKYLSATPRFDIYAINGHSTHIAQGVPDEDDIAAAEVVNAAIDLSGALVFSVGCHGGLNDPGVLDLPQAYLQKQVNYVGNTGFGWGSGGIAYSEELLLKFVRELVRNTKTDIGPSLTAAKKKYYSQSSLFNAFDAKVLMQMTLYGLPMVEVTSGGTLVGDDPFPSAEGNFTPPSALGAIAEGTAGYQLPGSFGAFGDAAPDASQVAYDLDGNAVVSAGDPVQPRYFAGVDAPAAGELRGAIFLGGVYSDVVDIDPVIALADNEYVADKSEPTFQSDSFYPALPFAVRSGVPDMPDTVVMTLGQYKSSDNISAAGTGDSGTTRIYDQMTFATYYSDSPDRNAANITFVDAVLVPSQNVGQVKVAASDSSGIHRVLIAYTLGDGQWHSQDLTLDEVTQKWTGVISATTTTQYFVQVVDNVGNVAINNNKGANYPVVVPLPLAAGNPVAIDNRVFLPLVSR